jgi:hypothetical protein
MPSTAAHLHSCVNVFNMPRVALVAPIPMPELALVAVAPGKHTTIASYSSTMEIPCADCDNILKNSYFLGQFLHLPELRAPALAGHVVSPPMHRSLRVKGNNKIPSACNLRDLETRHCFYFLRIIHAVSVPVPKDVVASHSPGVERTVLSHTSRKPASAVDYNHPLPINFSFDLVGGFASLQVRRAVEFRCLLYLFFHMPELSVVIKTPAEKRTLGG